MRTAKYRRLDIVEHLLTLGANINLANMIGYTALMDSAWKGRVKCLELLIEKGAGVNFIDVTQTERRN